MKFLKRAVIAVAVIGILFGGFKVYFEAMPTANSRFMISSRSGKEFYLTAHRGLSGIAPENTCQAISEAGKAGYYAAEFDIMPTKDGVWVLMHDDTVDRMTDGTGEVSSFTYEELLELKIDSGNGIENYPKLRINTLEEALLKCEDYSMRAMIEIKGGEPEQMAQVLEIVEAANLKTEPLIIDFDSERLEELRALDGDMELWYLVSKIDEEDIEFAKQHNTALAFNFGKIRNYGMLSDAKNAGIKLAAWTVDILPVADFLISIGVNYITTNRILPETYNKQPVESTGCLLLLISNYLKKI